MPKKRPKYVFESSDDGAKLDFFENEIMTPDNKHFLITVDPAKDDYAVNSQLWVRNKLRTFSKMKEKSVIDSKDAAQRSARIDEIRKKFSSKFEIDFSSREHLLEEYLKDMKEEIPDATVNALGGGLIVGKYGEGILDFIYADFNKIYTELKEKDFIEKYPISDGDSVLDGIYNRYAYFCNSFFNYEDLFAQSLYTYICPPLFVRPDKEKNHLKFYVAYLHYWQIIYHDLLEFCYDENYYPEFLGNLYPHERYYIYCSMQGLPTSVNLKQKHSIVDNKLTGDKMPFGLTELEIDERYKNAIKLTKDFKKFAKEYDCRADILHMLFQSPRFIHICYEFSRIEEILNVEFMRMLELDIRFVKCQRCGRYFVRKTGKDVRYCDRIEPGTNKTCKDLATLDNFRKNHQDDIATQIYLLYYKRYRARFNPNNADENKIFNEWRYTASAKKIECEQGKMTPQEYDDWNFKYFPNRKNSKFFK